MNPLTLRANLIGLAFLLGPATALTAQTASTDAPPFAVEVLGSKGATPMILIPGVTNDGSVWEATVNALGDRYEMHVLSLPGFAGRPPIATDSGWLELMRDEIVRYARSNRLEKPVLVGHSLGGFLALWIAVSSPELPSAIVNVDGLPFLGGTMDTTATVASVRGQAAQRRSMMSAPGDAEQFERMQAQQVRMLVKDSAGRALVTQHGLASDRRTVATAMYELYTTDLRPDLGRITVPVLNLHAWSAYSAFGMTKERAVAMFNGQYRGLPDATTRLHDEAYHFLMYDAPEWMHGEMRAFLAKVRR